VGRLRRKAAARLGRRAVDRAAAGWEGGTTNQAWADQKVGFYHAVINEMLKQRFGNAEIGKFGGGNFCRVFDAATSGHD
jgi:membrane dipeptidase